MPNTYLNLFEVSEHRSAQYLRDILPKLQTEFEPNHFRRGTKCQLLYIASTLRTPNLQQELQKDRRLASWS